MALWDGLDQDGSGNELTLDTSISNLRQGGLNIDIDDNDSLFARVKK